MKGKLEAVLSSDGVVVKVDLFIFPVVRMEGRVAKRSGGELYFPAFYRMNETQIANNYVLAAKMSLLQAFICLRRYPL